MKKILMTMAAVLCCAMISTAFTACGNENESVSDYAAYRVNPSGQFGNTNCLAICEQMREALRKNLTDENGLCKRNDDKAISICDEAYKKATPSGHFTIVLTVTPFGNGLDNQSTTIKSWEN